MTYHERTLALVRTLSSLANPNRYAQRRHDGQGYSVIHETLTEEKLVAHTERKIALSVHPLIADKTCIGVLDLDDHQKILSWSQMAEVASKLVAELNARGLRPLAFRSGGGRGIHLFLLFKEPQEAGVVRRMLTAVVAACGYRSGSGGVDVGDVEVFPKQDHEGEKGGNPIALPLSRESRLLGPDFGDLTADMIPEIGTMLNGNLDPASYPPPARKHSQRRRGAVDIEIAKSLLSAIPADEYDTWVKVGMILRAEYDDDGYDLWVGWSETVESRVSPNFKAKWKSFGEGGQLTIGSLFHLARENGWEPDSAAEIADMNERFGIVTRGSVTQIIDKLATYDPETPIHFLSVKVLKDRVRAEPTFLNAKDKGTGWMESERRSHYHSVDFDPSRPAGDNGLMYNVWKGFNVDPQPGDWSLYRNFIKDVIAGGDEGKARWIINWMALGVQQPSSPIGTVPVLRGKPGTGKSFFANMYGYIWRPHAMVVTHPDHVAGKFNGFNFGKRFVFIDEGYYGGDKAKAGVIKTRVTEQSIIVERKGVDAIQVPNRMIFMMASNEENVVPADMGDRRWMILDVADVRKEDHAYFEAIQTQMENGGYAAMLYDLLHLDITEGPNPRRIIRSMSLVEQYLRNAPADISYLHDILNDGMLPRSSKQEPNVTCVAALYYDLKKREPNHRFVNSAALAKRIKAACGAIRLDQNGSFRHLGGETERSTNYAFPSLEEARRHFEAYIGLEVGWATNAAAWLPEDEIDL